MLQDWLKYRSEVVRAGASGQSGVVSLAIDGVDPQDVAAILDQTFGIEVRAGLHCAPGAHRAIGSFGTGGTVRFSVGPFTTADEIASAIDAVRQVACSLAGHFTRKVAKSGPGRSRLRRVTENFRIFVSIY